MTDEPDRMLAVARLRHRKEQVGWDEAKLEVGRESLDRAIRQAKDVGMSLREIAQVLGVSHPTVLRMLRRTEEER